MIREVMMITIVVFFTENIDVKNDDYVAGPGGFLCLQPCRDCQCDGKRHQTPRTEVRFPFYSISCFQVVTE